MSSWFAVPNRKLNKPPGRGRDLLFLLCIWPIKLEESEYMSINSKVVELRSPNVRSIKWRYLGSSVWKLAKSPKSLCLMIKT